MQCGMETEVLLILTMAKRNLMPMPASCHQCLAITLDCVAQNGTYIMANDFFPSGCILFIFSGLFVRKSSLSILPQYPDYRSKLQNVKETNLFMNNWNLCFQKCGVYSCAFVLSLLKCCGTKWRNYRFQNDSLWNHIVFIDIVL